MIVKLIFIVKKCLFIGIKRSELIKFWCLKAKELNCQIERSLHFSAHNFWTTFKSENSWLICNTLVFESNFEIWSLRIVFTIRLFVFVISIGWLASLVESQSIKSKWTRGKSGDFCGRGPNRKDCCGYYCDIAPNDEYAIWKFSFLFIIQFFSVSILSSILLINEKIMGNFSWVI